MPTRFGRSEVSKADQRLSKALSHPLRAECLTILNARVASPAEIARQLDEEVANVSYHIKVLLELDCIELVDTRTGGSARGATEHFYRGVAQKYLDDDMWAKLSHPVRNGISLTAIRVVVGAIRDAVEAGIFDRLKDRHVSVVTYQLDGDGWDEMKALYKETLERGMAIGARAEGRIAERKHRGKVRRITCSLLAHESPEGSPRRHELGEVIEGRPE
jgi:DNA-binding transcriptional ArsR family regulator